VVPWWTANRSIPCGLVRRARASAHRTARGRRRLRRAHPRRAARARAPGDAEPRRPVPGIGRCPPGRRGGRACAWRSSRSHGNAAAMLRRSGASGRDERSAARVNASRSSALRSNQYGARCTAAKVTSPTCARRSPCTRRYATSSGDESSSKSTSYNVQVLWLSSWPKGRTADAS
jgi:hypothetical protein